MSFQSARIQTKTRQIDFQIDLDPADPNENFLLQHLRQGICYEPDVVHILLRTVKPGGFVLDIGANIGFFTILMSKLVGPTGRVSAFECNPEVTSKLIANIEKNQLDNVGVYHNPLWHRPGPVQFWVNRDSTGGSALWDVAEWPQNTLSQLDPKVLQLNATTIDILMAPEKHAPSVIKMDVEGAEFDIMRGAWETLERADYPATIISELNPFGLKQLGGSTGEYRDFMFERGYELFLPSVNGTLPAMVPRNSEVAYVGGVQTTNGLFSTVTAVGEAWPKVPMDYD